MFVVFHQDWETRKLFKLSLQSFSIKKVHRQVITIFLSVISWCIKQSHFEWKARTKSRQKKKKIDIWLSLVWGCQRFEVENRQRLFVDVNCTSLGIPWLGLKTCLSLSNLLLRSEHGVQLLLHVVVDTVVKFEIVT